MSKLSGFYSPKEAAEYLRIPVDRLTMLLRVEKLPFTDLSEKGDAVPWKAGPKNWGLTSDQIMAIVETRSRRLADDSEKTAQEQIVTQGAMLQALIPGHDGMVRMPPRTVPKRTRRLKSQSKA